MAERGRQSGTGKGNSGAYTDISFGHSDLTRNEAMQRGRGLSGCLFRCDPGQLRLAEAQTFGFSEHRPVPPTTITASPGKVKAVSLVKVVERTFTDAMEQLQEGYVAAVAATCGVSAQFVTRDMHKYDVEFVRQPDGDVEEVSVKAQLKSTTTVMVRPGASSFRYRFESHEAYASLAMKRGLQKHILILMVIHQDQSRWTYSHHRAMLLRHCCYWLNMEGFTSSADRPYVSVPTANVFNAAALTGILDRIEGGLAP